MLLRDRYTHGVLWGRSAIDAGCTTPYTARRGGGPLTAGTALLFCLSPEANYNPEVFDRHTPDMSNRVAIRCEVIGRIYFRGGLPAPVVSAPLNEIMSNNIVILQGRFEMAAPPETIDLGGSTTLLLRAWVFTDKLGLGGQHQVWITDDAATHTIRKAREWEASGSARLPEVLVEGSLFSHNNSTHVKARLIRFLGYPEVSRQTVVGRLVNREPNSPAGRFELCGVTLSDGDTISLMLDERWLPGSVLLVDARYVFLPDNHDEAVPLASGMLARRGLSPQESRNSHRNN